MESLRKIVSASKFSSTEEKINSFANGYGTVVFFEDTKIIKGLQEAYKTYSDNFPVWAQHSSGILQFIVWSSLEIEGYGASLQHYSEIISTAVKEEFNIPVYWEMVAQMPFGKSEANAQKKTLNHLRNVY